MSDVGENELRRSMDRLHTTRMGAERVRRNLGLDVPDVIAWCREKILDPSCRLERRGKNWYVGADGCEITVNAHSLTVITAHRCAKD